MRDIADLADLGPGSEAVANYISICNNTADSYPQSIAHGLQKDAIQNSLDARKNKKSTVRVEFCLVKNQRGEFLTFTDSNTKGLTGDTKNSQADYKNLREDDHWARFEAFAFTKDDPDALGARGQGKFIFLRASREYQMFYDTLRDDGVYRLGATQATQTGRPVYPERGKKWEDNTAKSRLDQHCGLDALCQVGTRVIVCAPIQEVVAEIRSGKFALAIQETWFRAMEKNQLEVLLSVDGQTQRIGLPDHLPLADSDSKHVKTWVYSQDFDANTVSIEDNFKIKNFHAVCYAQKSVAADYQGIAILQNGMKITTLEMDIASPEIRERITGFIEFDTELDRELRKGKNQNPNHYDLKWRSKNPRDIKAFVQRQLSAFGRKKLGIRDNEQAQRRRGQDNAERQAMSELARFAKDLKLRGSRRKSGGGGLVGPTPPPPSDVKDIGVSMAVEFADSAKKPRVDWGENIQIGMTCYNKTPRDIDAHLALRVLHGDSVVEELVDEKIRLTAHSTGARICLINGGTPIRIRLTQNPYRETGEYRIRALLTDRVSGDKLDILTRKFWLGDEPPRQQPFKLEASNSIPGEDSWVPEGDIDNDPIIWYNTNHPEYLAKEDDEQACADYLFDIGLKGALHFILTRPHDANDKPDYSPLDTKSIVGSGRALIPEKVYQEISRYTAKVRWRKFGG